MSQLTFSDDVRFSEYKPHMIPQFHGGFTPVESLRPNPWYPTPMSESSRRYEGRTIAGEKPKYNSNGVPTMNSAAVCPRSGVGKGPTRKYDTFYTPEGNVKLPRQLPEVLPCHFLPTSTSLEIATHAIDTRLHAPPPRFYNHR